jgi:hypothetical protein
VARWKGLWKHRTSNNQHPTPKLEKPGKDAQSHGGAKVEGRMKNEELAGKAT